MLGVRGTRLEWRIALFPAFKDLSLEWRGLNLGFRA